MTKPRLRRVVSTHGGRRESTRKRQQKRNTMTGRPELAAILADPANVAEVPRDAIPAVLGELERLKTALWLRLLPDTPRAMTGDVPPDGLDGLRHVTPQRLSQLLDLKLAYVHELCRTGKLPATKSGKYWMISVVGVRNWLGSGPRQFDERAVAGLESLNPRGDAMRTEARPERKGRSRA